MASNLNIILLLMKKVLSLNIAPHLAAAVATGSYTMSLKQ